MREIPLGGGLVAVVDDEDFERAAPFTWHALRLRGRTYAIRNLPRAVRRSGQREHYYLHRLLLDAPAGVLVDHRDCDGLNNRRENLRLCSNTQNSQNARKRRQRTASRFKGVVWEKRTAKWVARLTIGGPQRHLGSFDSEEAAAWAYDAAALREWGAFARPNFGGQSV